MKVDLHLLPLPRKVRRGKGCHDLSAARWVIVDSSFSTYLKRHAMRLVRRLNQRLGRPIEFHTGWPQDGMALLRLMPDRGKIHPQGCEMVVGPDGIRVTAADDHGAFYALETVAQLLEQSGFCVPDLSIQDYPDFVNRGVMIDISRCKVPTMATLEALIDTLARLRINQVQLYTEHTFAFSAHETVWADASPVTAAEIVHLDAYCRERFIELIPNLNSFGHFERWLRHPEYHHLAECPDGFEFPWGGRRDHGMTLRPGRTTLRFLDGLYAEFLPNFSSTMFNAGCDETWELGQGASRRACEKRGTTRVYLDFVLGVHKLVKKHGRRMMFWGDIVQHSPELVHELPSDITALEWGYEADHLFSKRCRHFVEGGIPFYVCPGTSSWNALTGRTDNCLANLMNAARNGHRYGAEGYLITDWGDGGHHQYLPISYVGFVAGSAYAWCRRANADLDIAAEIGRHVVADRAGIFGAVLTELGMLHKLLPVQPKNSTVFNKLLFGDTEVVNEIARKSGTTRLQRCERGLTVLEERLAGVRPSVADGSLIKREVKNAMAMTRLGIRRGLMALGHEIGNADMRRDLRRIIGCHEDLWLARNRHGGLQESSARLRGILNYL